MGSNDMPELGSKISLISKADIRYEGKLFTVDPQECTIALANVRSFGTEDRVTDHPVPAQAQVYDYILFRATDIKDISVIPSPPVLFDPAIVQLSIPPTIGSGGSGARFQGGFQHPIVGAFGGNTSEPVSRAVGSGPRSSYGPMQSNIISPLQQRSRQPRSVGELLGNTGGGGGGGGGGGDGDGVSRSSTPHMGGKQSEQGSSRFDQPNQRNRNNSQSNSSNHEDRSANNPLFHNSRQFVANKFREHQPRYGNRNNMENGFNRDNLNDGNYNRDHRNDGGYNRNSDNGYGNRNNPQNMQPRRYQNMGGQQQQQQNQRGVGGGGSRGTSGDRLQDQQRGGGGGQRRNQGRMNNGQRQGNNQRQGQRGGNGGQRRQFPFQKQQQPKQPLKFDSDYDFDKANTEFEELRLSLAQVKISDAANTAPNNPPGANTEDKKDDSGNETAVGECDQEDEGVQQVSSAYDKTKSFFDNISCEAIERSKGRSQRTDWRKELKLNSETFGVTMSRRFYVPRGRGYYNRGNSWNYKPRQQNNIIVAKV